MVNQVGYFAWYELVTTDPAAAGVFYSEVIGWRVKDASTPALAYSLFADGDAPVCGLMDLPDEGRRLGATPRWIGYVAVDDVDARAAQISRLGGAVFVPPTTSNIGRISIVADPQEATFGLLAELSYGDRQAGGLDAPGRVGWHELLAVDRNRIFDFYGEVFGWQKDSESDPAEFYQLFSAGGQTIGGMLTKLPSVSHSFWLHYINVDDIGAAAERVNALGGRVLQGPIELPDGCWIIRCADPQGALFALQGPYQGGSARASATEVTWSARWGGIASQGRMVLDRPKR